MSPDAADTLYFFDSEIDLAPARVVVQTTVPQVTERVVIHQPPKSAYLAREVVNWSPEDLRDYVAAEIVKRFGVFPRDARKEHSIFTSFAERWGIEKAVAIATYAFETMDGRWKGAPVKMQRFCKNSDPYFAKPISEYLDTHT